MLHLMIREFQQQFLWFYSLIFIDSILRSQQDRVITISKSFSVPLRKLIMCTLVHITDFILHRKQKMCASSLRFYEDVNTLKIPCTCNLFPPEYQIIIYLNITAGYMLHNFCHFLY
jgi:hypothetical protein